MAAALPPTHPTPPAAPRWRGVVVLVAALALGTLTARLGVWQLDRAAQKKGLQQALTAQAEAPVLAAEALPRSAGEAEQARHRRVLLRGQWLPQHTIYLDNRQMRGRPGFFVLTPLQLPGGDAVLVQRGWLPRHFTERTHIAPYTTAAGEVQVSGRIAPWPSRLADLGAEPPGAIRQNLDFSAYAAETGLALRPLAVTELAAEGGPAAPADGLLRDWPRPAVDVAKHHGYAAQWFALSALTAGLYVWFQLIQPRRRRRSSTGTAPHG